MYRQRSSQRKQKNITAWLVGEVQTSSSPGRIRTVVESAEMDENRTSPYPPLSETIVAVSSNAPLTEVIFHKEGRGVAGRGRGASNRSSSNRTITCFLCKASHFIRDCPYKAKTITKGHCGACAGSGHRATHHAKMPPCGWPFNADLQCYRCKGRGHSKKECPSQFNSPTTQTQAYFGEYDEWHDWQGQDESQD